MRRLRADAAPARGLRVLLVRLVRRGCAVARFFGDLVCDVCYVLEGVEM